MGPFTTFTHEQLASIDWTDVQDVEAHHYTFLQLASYHPKLADYVDNILSDAERDAIIRLFLGSNEPDDEDEEVLSPELVKQRKAALLTQWHQKGLLTLRESRYCRHCLVEGHTKGYCPKLQRKKQHSAGKARQLAEDALDVTAELDEDDEEEEAEATRSNCMQRFHAHLQFLERQRLVQEKMQRSEDAQKKIVSLVRKPFVRGGGAAPPGPTEGAEPPAQFAVDERKRGCVTRIEKERGIGFVNIADCGEVRFFLDRTDYGIKEPNVNDFVTLKLDMNREVPTAVEVRPEKANLSPADVDSFLHRCRTTTKPLKLLETILMQKHEWSFLVQTILAKKAQSIASFVSSVNVLVALTTFGDNREPIHFSVLGSFLALLGTPTGPSAGTAFFPDLLSLAVETPLDAVDIELLVDLATEASNLVLLLRQGSNISESVILPLSGKLSQQLTQLPDAIDRSASTSPSHKRVLKKRIALALQRLQKSSEMLEELKAAFFPSAAELSVPPPLAESPFSAHNLPVNVTTKFEDAQSHIQAHWKLLRADTFEATCRVLAAACYELPHYQPTDQTKSDVEYARVLHHVRFAGRVVTRDRDFSHSDSYLFFVKPRSKRVNMQIHFGQGTCFCITTSLDRTKMEDSEIFWGVVSSSDSLFLQAGILVLARCEGSNSFEKLVENLQRNEALGRTECSQFLEVPLFFSGYRSVVQALLSFVGPAPMTLPMSDLVVLGKSDVEEDLDRLTLQKPVEYLPPHAAYAFEQLVESVRSKFILDKGQDEAMRRLSTSEVLTIQGPPGTGKSFIGARIVEVYIRFKQLASSGDILGSLDISQLASTKWDKMIPSIGPVVVITYKNHALDEFLLDLLKSGLWNDERQRLAHGTGKVDAFPQGRRVVRVGGRSREPELNAYNLNTLMAAKTDKSSYFSFRDRVFLMNQRLERLAREIQLLEKGKVPRMYFDRWLTDEQRSKIRYEDREEWLSGERYTGLDEEKVDKDLYLTLLQSALASELKAAAEKPATPAAPASVTAKSEDEDEDDISLSVFQEMKREDESREMNNNLRNIAIAAEALRWEANPPTLPVGIPQPLLSLWSLPPRLRHQYYAYLIQVAIVQKVKDCLKIMDVMASTIALRNHAHDEARLELLQGADVIGFTTTGCATYQNLIRSLRPSVLVVEEAAEVLESQLLACMTDSLKQIVLIGDHYQLKPKVDTFLYEKVNNLNVSMFERLAGIMRPIRLVEQRRMHPTISQLIRPFYDGQPLEDHETVLIRPFVDAAGHKRPSNQIPGLGSTTMFLWEHDHPEEEAPNSRSKINTMELSMVVNLVDHIVAQGALPKSITVITPYLGQSRALRNVLRLRAHQLRDVRVSTVDLYQGDENDIVILSMVRTQKLTDFLKMRNRMIVACSRARFAMIIIGNSDLLELSPHWRQVLEMLREMDAIGKYLPVTFGSKRVLVKNDDPWPGSKRRRSKSASPSRSVQAAEAAANIQKTEDLRDALDDI